ncbi:MAG: DUF4349 domain-containing protein [Acidimicrobiales bacterium]
MVAALVLLSACGDDGAGKSSSTANNRAAGAVAGDVTATPNAAPAATGADIDQSVLLAQAAGRQVIFTARLQVEVADVFSAVAEAKRLASVSGGYLFSERSVEVESSAQPQSEITFKLPPERFAGVMDDLARLGRERGRQVDASDVTAQLVDLDARLKSADASLERVRKLLGDAKTVQEIVSIEAELTKRETQVEQLKGQLNQISRQVEFATVTVTFGEKLATAKADDLPGPLDALAASARVLLVSLFVVVLVLAVVLPFIPVVLLALFAGRFVARRLRRQLPPPVPPRAAPDPPSPVEEDELAPVS